MLKPLTIVVLSIALAGAVNAQPPAGSEGPPGGPVLMDGFETIVTEVNVNVPGNRDQGNPVNVSLPNFITVTVSNLSGEVCLGGAGIVCTGPAGVSAATCNETTDECICPPQCGNANFGALMRGSCVMVTNGQSFNTGPGNVPFFINGDCNPSNNTGSFNFILSY